MSPLQLKTVMTFMRGGQTGFQKELSRNLHKWGRAPKCVSYNNITPGQWKLCSYDLCMKATEGHTIVTPQWNIKLLQLTLNLILNWRNELDYKYSKGTSSWMDPSVELLPRDTLTDSIGTFPILVSWLDVELTVCVSLETLWSVNCQGQIKR